MIDVNDLFKVFQQQRGDAVVIPVGTSGRQWYGHSTNTNRDLNLGGAMGHATSAALGVALSLPDEKVVMFDAEGALLMNLGILATIAGKAPKNFYHFVLDNECYATTGGQPVPNAKNINYAGMAKEAGYAAAYSFDNLDDIVENLEQILHQTGPVFVAVKVVPMIENEPIGRRKRMPLPTRAASVTALREELGITDG
jgi:sulfopyruvate decarboxylase subunit beta